MLEMEGHHVSFLIGWLDALLIQMHRHPSLEPSSGTAAKFGPPDVGNPSRLRPGRVSPKLDLGGLRLIPDQAGGSQPTSFLSSLLKKSLLLSSTTTKAGNSSTSILNPASVPSSG